MVGTLLSYWEGSFSGVMLNFGRVLLMCTSHTSSPSTNSNPPTFHGLNAQLAKPIWHLIFELPVFQPPRGGEKTQKNKRKKTWRHMTIKEERLVCLFVCLLGCLFVFHFSVQCVKLVLVPSLTGWKKTSPNLQDLEHDLAFVIVVIS